MPADGPDEPACLLSDGSCLYGEAAHVAWLNEAEDRLWREVILPDAQRWLAGRAAQARD
jgi:hypothetical protein